MSQWPHKMPFFGESMCEALRIEESIGTPKQSDAGRVYESSSQLHRSDITNNVALTTLYDICGRADNQHLKEALQIYLLISEIIPNVAFFPKKGAHMLGVLYRMQLSRFLMMDTWLEQWEVSGKNEHITGVTCSSPHNI